VVQRHLDRLSSTDAKFLHLEDGRPSHMHVGAVGIFDGPAPGRPELLDHVASRLDRVPRYRQRLLPGPWGLLRQRWVDDPHFQLDYHVRFTALPSPGGRGELLALCARVLGQRLDRGRPLWEMWIVEGLEQDRFAILSKSHHAMVDGISGVDIMTAVFDLQAEPVDERPAAWVPQPTAGSARLVAGAALGLGAGLVGAVGTGLDALRHPQTHGRAALASLGGLGELLWQYAEAAPRSPLNAKVGPHRRVAVLRRELADVKAVKDALGGTVNDVMLAAVSGALGALLRERGVATDGMSVRALVPVSLRTEAQRGALGNQITAMFAALPVGVAEPVQRLRAVRAEMDRLKGSRRLLGAQLLTSMEEFAPPTVLAQASRLTFSPRLVNTIVTNVPGPQFPIYLRGRRLREVYPFGFLAADLTLMIAIMSYDGGVHIGLIGDHDAMRDIGELAGHLGAALDELCHAAGVSPAAPAPVPRPGPASAAGRQPGRPRSAATARRPPARTDRRGG
jgi:diacylglycerol O-acyltransferase